MNANEILSALIKKPSGSSFPTSSLLGTQLTTSANQKVVSLSNGSKRTLRLKSENSIKNRRKRISNHTEADLNIGNLIYQLDLDQRAKEERQNQEQSNMNELMLAMDKELDSGNILWTEKYRPKKFIDLIGNERINSLILSWLNEWDFCTNQLGKKRKFNSEDEDQPNADPLKRPFKKFLLIHGPPGIGKTTIAHAICNQLGYSIHEINSSDERSGDIVKQKMINTLSGNDLKGKRGCLILDEADGASGKEGGILKFLINLSFKDKKGIEKYQQKGESKDLIKRPVILICNDVYSTSLDQIKPFCEIVTFKKPNKLDIKKRLIKICQLESQEVSSELLDDLIESMDGDLRNCINFLQFNSNASNIKNNLKDSQNSWYKILRDIFNRRLKVSKATQYSRVVESLDNIGDKLDRVVNGCFNGILQVENINLKNYCVCNEWMEFYDEIHHRGHLYEGMNKYESLVPLKVFQMLNEVGDGRDIDFKSKSEYEFKMAFLKVVEDVRYRNLNTSVSNLITYELGLLLKIVLQKTRQPRKLKHSADLVRDMGVMIESVKSNERFSREYTYRFRPDISLAAHASLDSCSKEMEILRDRLRDDWLNDKRQRDLDRERTKEAGSTQGRGASPGHDAAGATDQDDVRASRQPGEPKRKLTTVDFFRRQYGQFADADKDMRGAGISCSESTPARTTPPPEPALASASASPAARARFRIWVKYHEGFSNAVRKETSWRALFAPDTT